MRSIFLLVFFLIACGENREQSLERSHLAQAQILKTQAREIGIQEEQHLAQAQAQIPKTQAREIGIQRGQHLAQAQIPKTQAREIGTQEGQHQAQAQIPKTQAREIGTQEGQHQAQAQIPETQTREIVSVCDRSWQIKNAIMEKIAEKVDDSIECDQAHELLDAITVLDNIRGRRFEQIRAKPGDFDGLSSLEILTFEGDLSTLLPDMFRDLSSLKILNLIEKEWPRPQKPLSLGVFNGLSALEKLTLDTLSLTPGIFQGLSSVKHLHVRGLKTLLPGTFHGLSSLENLNLRRNKLTSISVGAFDGLFALKKLDLSEQIVGNIIGIGFESLPPGVFNGLGSLEILYLEDSGLKSLSVGVFDGLPSLKELDISGGMLLLDCEEGGTKELPPGVFNGLSALERLDLSQNRLMSLPPGIFNGLSSLKELNLSLQAGIFWEIAEDIGSISLGVFDNGLSALENLNLRRINLQSVASGAFNNLPSLKELNLRENKLSRRKVNRIKRELRQNKNLTIKHQYNR